MRKFGFVMLALVLALGMAFVSCGDGDGNNNTPGDNGGGSGNSGYRIATMKGYYIPLERLNSTIYYRYRSDNFLDKTEYFDGNGVQQSTTTNFYNASSWLVRTESVQHATGNLVVTEYEYEVSENLVRTTTTSTTSTGVTGSISEETFSGGKQTGARSYSLDGTTLLSTATYSDGKAIEGRIYNPDGSLNAVTTFSYNSSGRPEAQTTSYPSIGQITVLTYTYDSDGRLDFTTTSINGEPSTRTEYTYERGIGRTGRPRPDGTVP